MFGVGVSSLILAVLLAVSPDAPAVEDDGPPSVIDDGPPAVVSDKPVVEPEPVRTETPGATAAQDAQGRIFYSLIDASGYTHWSYDWPALWREVEAVNQGYATANDRRLAAMREDEERWRRANAAQATWAAQRQAQGQANRPMYYVRPLAAALPTLGGSGAICST
jgi:hypothetical protein